MPQMPWEKYAGVSGPWSKYQSDASSIPGVSSISAKGPVTEYTIEATGKTLPLPTAMPETRVRQLIDGHIRAATRGPDSPTVPSRYQAYSNLADKTGEAFQGAIKELGGQGMRALGAIGVKPGTTLPLPGLPGGMTMTTPTPEQRTVASQPSNTAESAGQAMVRIGEYMLPAAVVKSLLPAQAAALSTAGKAGMEAASAYGVSRAQGQSPEQAATGAAVAGGITGGIGKLFGMAPALGRRIESVVLKPAAVDLKATSAPISEASDKLMGDVFKYKLGGTLTETYDKSVALLKNLGQSLRTVLKSNPTATVNLDDVWLETLQDMTASAGGKFTFASDPAKSAALNKLADGITALGGKVNLADANEIKQAVGILGSWSNGVRDREAAAMEEVASVMYTKLRRAIEKSAGQSAPAIKELNRQMGDVIPIHNAVVRRIPVAARREPISLKEALGLVRGNVPGVGLAIADRALRSGTVANTLANTTTGAAAPVGRIGAALAGEIQRRP